jgi:hypothetical protein
MYLLASFAAMVVFIAHKTPKVMRLYCGGFPRGDIMYCWALPFCGERMGKSIGCDGGPISLSREILRISEVQEAAVSKVS